MAEPLLRVDGLLKRFGGLIATNDVSLDVREGELHAIIGPNGAGKTTLITQLSGELRSDCGRIMFCGNDVTAISADRRALLGLARSFQITSVFRDFTVLQNVMLAVQAHAGHSFRFFRAADKQADLIEPARATLVQVGLSEREQVLAARLAHGEQRALEIAMALATKPKLLLLDEPMAGMGSEDSARLVQFLLGLKRHYTILLVEHDMNAVFKLADRISVLVYGRIIATDTGQGIRANARVREAYLGEDESL